MTMSIQQRLDDHELVYQMWKLCDEYCYIIEFIGNKDKASDVRELLRKISREHVLDRILKKEGP
jgi:hypothetical protein